MITKQELDNSVINFYNNNRQTFNKKNYIKNGYSESTINKYYKKWSNLCEELNLPYEKRNRFSKEEILLDIKTVINNTNNSNRDNYLKYGNYSKSAYEKYIGTWNEILIILNIDINIQKNVTKEEVIQEMLYLKEKYGYFTAVIQRKHSKYSQPVIDRLFGSFSNMLRELEIRTPYGKNITDDEFINEIKNINKKYGTISHDLIFQFSSLTPATVIHRFGSLPEAYRIAGISPNYSNRSKLSIYVLNICTDILGEKPIMEYTFNWLRNPKTNKKLFVDAYYKKHNLIIEVDGQQHYFKKTSFSENLENVQYRDKIKNQLIPKHNINLVRIPYYFSIDEIINTIERYIIG